MPAEQTILSRSAFGQSGKRRDTWQSHFWFRKRYPVVAGRCQYLFRLQRHLPGDFFAGVRGHSPHDRHQRTLRHVVAVVDRFAAANRSKQFVVLGLVKVVVFAGTDPFIVRFDRQPPFGNVGRSSRSKCLHAQVGVTAGHLSAIAKEPCTVGVFIRH